MVPSALRSINIIPTKLSVCKKHTSKSSWFKLGHYRLILNTKQLHCVLGVFYGSFLMRDVPASTEQSIPFVLKHLPNFTLALRMFSCYNAVPHRTRFYWFPLVPLVTYSGAKSPWNTVKFGNCVQKLIPESRAHKYSIRENYRVYGIKK